MKFRVGDKVRVIHPKDSEEAELREHQAPYWIRRMGSMKDVYSISRISYAGYIQAGGDYYFHPDWLKLSEEILWEIQDTE